MEFNKETWQIIKRILLVILGSCILGLGTGIFLIPYNIISGGLSGMAIILNSLFGFDVEIVITILTWVFFALGWIILGTKFAAKTILSTIIYPLAVILGSYLQQNTVLTLGTIEEVSGSINIFLAGIFGGVLVGTGVGLTFLGGGSTGGVDVITLALKKFFNFKASITSFCVDASVILLGFILVKNGSFGATLNGIVSAFIASFMISRLFDNQNYMVVNIISKKYKEINSIVIKELNRGSTLISGVGGYTNEEIKILQVALDIREYYILMDIIAKVDRNAFVTVSKANAVKGEGFSEHENQALIGKRKNDKAK